MKSEIQPFFMETKELIPDKFVMKFRGIFFLSLFGFLFLSFREHNTLTHFGLKGKVKQLITTSYLISGETEEKSSYSLSDSSTYNFNEDGKLISVFYYGRASEKNKEIYTYDNDGHIKSHAVSYSNNLHSDSIFYTYKNGLLAEIYSVSIYWNAVFRSGKTVFYYEMDQLVAKREFDSRGEIFLEQLYTYNEQGKLISEIENIPSMGKNMDSLFRKYEYDSAGLLYSQRSSGRKSNTLLTFQYNERGDEVRAARYSENSTMVHYGDTEYEYDSTGNWIKRIYSTSNSDGIPKKRAQMIYNRVITYY